MLLLSSVFAQAVDVIGLLCLRLLASSFTAWLAAWGIPPTAMRRSSGGEICDNEHKISERLGEEAAMAELSKEDLRKTNLLRKIHYIVEDRILPTVNSDTGCYTVLEEGDFSEIIQDLVLIATMCERGGPGIQGRGQAAPRAAPVGTPPSRPLADRGRSDRR